MRFYRFHMRFALISAVLLNVWRIIDFRWCPGFAFSAPNLSQRRATKLTNLLLNVKCVAFSWFSWRTGAWRRAANFAASPIMITLQRFHVKQFWFDMCLYWSLQYIISDDLSIFARCCCGFVLSAWFCSGAQELHKFVSCEIYVSVQWLIDFPARLRRSYVLASLASRRKFMQSMVFVTHSSWNWCVVSLNLKLMKLAWIFVCSIAFIN